MTQEFISKSSNFGLSKLGGLYDQSQMLAVQPWVRIMLSCPIYIKLIHVTYQLYVIRTGFQLS